MENKKSTMYLASLGCSKNLVDGQVILGHLDRYGFSYVGDPKMAEVIVVNTCSFIEAAKKESIDTILELADYKKDGIGVCKTLVVSGCLPQRYTKELEQGLPEVDLFIGTGEYHKVASFLDDLTKGKLQKKSFVGTPRYIHSEDDPRITSASYMAYLKVSEGCDRRCTFCIIPTIRGKLRSRTVESLAIEARKLVSQGVVELNIISQDLSSYGLDLNNGDNLFKLLAELEKIENLSWVRLFYYYPDDMKDEVIQKIADSSKICSYLDMPVQHFSTKILRRMNRKITGEEIHAKIKKLREKIPDIILRTSVIVGFPGETDEDFKLLMEGIQKSKFDHVGIFRYSDEDGTPAYKLLPKVDSDVIEARFDLLHDIQKKIVSTKIKKKLGSEIDVLFEGRHDETELLFKGRYYGQAPEIDGSVIINDVNLQVPKPGRFYRVKINEVTDYDLIGQILY